MSSSIKNGGMPATGNGATVIPLGPRRMAELDRLSPRHEAMEYVKKKLAWTNGISIIAQVVGEERLGEIVQERKPEDIRRITDAIYEIAHYLNSPDTQFASTLVKVLFVRETLEALYSAPVFKAEQISHGIYALCEHGGGEFASAVGLFLEAAISNIRREILWRPMIDQLVNLDALSAGAYFVDGSFDKYLQRWDESVALLERARDTYGLDHYARIVSGKQQAHVVEGSAFCTTADGTIRAPAYVNDLPTRDQNLESIKISIMHECGHHRWKSFMVNLHPDALRLDIIGAKFVRETKCGESGTKAFIITVKDGEGKETAHKVKSYVDLMKLVKYPKLLKALHNWADDKRVDALNMMNYEGIAEQYRENNDFLLTLRKELKGGGLATMLEALLQKTVCGKTHGELPESLKPAMEGLVEDLAQMEIREDTDGTDSLNVALRWYARLEPELDELASRVKVIDGDIEDELAKMMPKEFGNSEPVQDGDVGLANEQPGQIVISSKKGRKRGAGRGVDPFSFLDLPGGKPGSCEDGDGEPGGEGDGVPAPGKPGNGGRDEDKPGRPKNGDGEDLGDGAAGGKRLLRYDEWTGKGYRPGSKPVLEQARVGGRLIAAPAHLRNRVKTMFGKYVPKTGELVRGTTSGYPDPVLVDQYVENMEAGRVEEPKYFSNIVNERSNVVISVNVDISGSMFSDAGNGRTKLDVAIEGAAVISSAAHMLRYPIEINVFTGSETVEFTVLQATDKGILLPEVGTGATPMAGAVRHATMRTVKLRDRNHKRFAYQFWLTDGEPNCSGGDINAVADTGRAIEEARGKRIHTYGIVIASPQEKEHMEQAYSGIFGGGRYVVIDSAGQILKHLLRFMQRVVYFR